MAGADRSRSPASRWRRPGAIKYLRTIVTQLSYWPLLFRELRRADVVHVFSASYSSFLLAPLPAMLIAKLFGRPVILNYHSGEAPDHLRRSALARHVMRNWVDLNVVPSAFLRDVLAWLRHHGPSRSQHGRSAAIRVSRSRPAAATTSVDAQLRAALQRRLRSPRVCAGAGAPSGRDAHAGRQWIAGGFACARLR